MVVSSHSDGVGPGNSQVSLDPWLWNHCCICSLCAIVWWLIYRAIPLQKIYMSWNFANHQKEFQVLSQSPQGSVKIESNQPVKIEIPHLLHDLIWFEVSSFWSPSNKMNWLSFQEHYLHLGLLLTAPFCSFLFSFLASSFRLQLPKYLIALYLLWLQ